MAEELEVIIGANTSGVTRAEAALDRMAKSLANIERHLTKNDNVVKKTEKSFNSLEYATKNNRRELDRIGVTTKKTTAVIDKMGDEASQTATQLNQVGNSSWRGMDNLSKRTNVTAASIGKLGKTTNVNAVPAMQEFSRVIQDAPYGIMGVGNNIQQLTANFGNLVKQTGSARLAIKAMLSSLAGPAGILLAVSAITTALTVFSDEIFGSGKAAKTAAEELDEYIDSLKGVERAQLDASVSAAKELTQLRLLTQQATNSALANEERLAAVNELRNLYPDYLKGMTDEQILANGLSTAYAEVASNIMRKARAQAASNIMVQNLEEEIKLSNRLAAVESEIEDQREKNTKLLQKAQDVGGQNLYYREAAKGEEKVNKLLEERLGLQGKIQGRQLENINLTEDVKASGDLIVTPENVSVDESAQPVQIQPLRVRAETVNELPEGLRNFSMSPISTQVDMPTESLQEYINKLEEIRQNDALADYFQRNQELATIYSSAVGSAMTELGNVMQEKLAESGKVVQIFGGLVINTMTQVLSQLLQQAIQERLISQISKRAEQGKASAKGVTIATNAAAAAGPVGLALLPGFLASTQAMIQGSFAAIEGFNFGGFVGDRNLVRMNGNERVLTATEANTFNNLMQNRNVGTGDNSMKLDLHITGGLSGENISFALERYNLKSNRIG